VSSVESTVQTATGPLHSLRVLEVGTGIALGYAGRLLADLDADVIKVEPPDGDPLRLRRSLAGGATVDLFDALNMGKRVRTEHGADVRALLDSLAANVDMLLCDAASYSALELDLLTTVVPGLVVAVATRGGSTYPTGLDAPHLHATALSGISSMIGHRERRPLPPPYEIGEYETGVNLAGAALAALFYAKSGGRGQIVSVDTTEVLFSFIWSSSTMAKLTTSAFQRQGRRFPGSGGPYPLGIFPTQDGYVAAIGRSARDWKRLLGLMGNPSWADDPRFADPLEIARHHADEADRYLLPWFAAHTGRELLAMSQDSGFAMAPLNDLRTVLTEPQFHARKAFGAVQDDGDSPVIGRVPFTFSGLKPAPRPAPGRGGRATFRPRASAEGGPSTADPRAADSGPLTGLRVLDLGWIWSGPMVSAAFADLGAEVIKVEHRGRLDNARLRGRPMVDGVPVDGPLEELSPNFHQNNRGKKSVTINMKHRDGRELMRELVAKSDLVIENLSPGVYERAGCGYADVRELNPGLIWLALSSAGRTGPLADLRAYAPTMSAMAGLESLVGYEDDPSVGMIACSLADPTAGSHALFAALAALVSRLRTGVGQYIDMSQIEATVSVLCEPLLEVQATDRPPPTWADLHPDFSPHGHFPASGTDRWVAIAALDDAMWARLADLVGDLAADRRLDSLSGRVEHRADVRRALAAWTEVQNRDALVALLRAHDVAAAPVLDVGEAESIYVDQFDEVVHPVTGPERLIRVPWRLELTPARIRRSAPIVGADTAQILGELLGRSAEEQRALEESGASQ
jgi:crotonobetainyl-CoA:carnitine CoA-transferase CaiB-like acyl-CoA transferase